MNKIGLFFFIYNIIYCLKNITENHLNWNSPLKLFMNINIGIILDEKENINLVELKNLLKTSLSNYSPYCIEIEEPLKVQFNLYYNIKQIHKIKEYEKVIIIN